MTLTDDSRAKYNLWILIAAQALIGAQMPILFTMGGLVGQTLAPNKCFATLPVTMVVLVSMFAAQPISGIMQRFGRTVGFMIGTFGGGIGAAIAAYAVYVSSFPILLVGFAFSGIYMSAQGFYRFAATDTASDAFRPKAISYVMAGGLLAAIIGPQLFKFTNGLSPISFFIPFIVMVGMNLFGAFLFLLLRIPRPPKPSADAPKGRTRWELIKTPRIAVAIICAMVSYALMNLVMTSTPLAVVGCGFGENNAADVVSSHVLAMYIPSFFTGHLIARFGAKRIVALGLVILAGAGAVGIAGVELENFFIALILLGIGWNFGFIGATSMLAAAHTPEERGRVQGMNDMIVFGCVTVASFASGGLMNCIGGDPQTGWTAVNMAMAPFLMLAGGALIWLWNQPDED